MLELINEFSNTAGEKINIQKSLTFLTLTTNYQKEKLRKQSIYHGIKKIPWNKLTEGDKGTVLENTDTLVKGTEGDTKGCREIFCSQMEESILLK